MISRIFQLHFFQIVQNNQNNRIPTNELKNTLDLLGYQLPNHEVRELINGLKNEGKLNESEGISKELLKEVCLHFCLHFSARARSSSSYLNQSASSERASKNHNKINSPASKKTLKKC